MLLHSRAARPTLRAGRRISGSLRRCLSTSNSAHVAGYDLSTLGGGGNRTRVLRRLIKASPGAACCSFLSPSVLAGKTLRAQSLFGFPTAPVTGAIGGALYRCQVPERGHIWADSSATVRQLERAGCYRHLSFCREWFSRSRDILDPLPLNRRPKSKPFTPVVGIVGQDHRTTT